MQQETILFDLRKGVFFVRGAKRAALYDTNCKDIFSINEVAKLGLEAILEGMSISEASQRLSLRQNDLESYIQLLQNNGLIIERNGNQFTEDKDLPSENCSPHLEFAWLELTKGCNLQCLHCYNESDVTTFPKTGDKKVLKHDDWKKIVSQLAGISVEKVQFIGGEPLLYKRIFDLAEFSIQQGIKKLEIFTNGTILDVEKVKKIKEFGLHIAVSLYGSSALVHDRITGIPGSFEQTVKGIYLLKESSIPLRICTVAMRDNEEGIDEVLNYIRNDLKVESRGYDIIRPIGRGSKDDLVPKLLYEKSLMKSATFQGIDLNTFLRRSHHHSCFYGKLYFDVYGDVFPCVMEREESLGNIKRQTIEELLARSSFRKYWDLTKDQIESCKDCEYRLACFDCRPKAKGRSGYLAKPKECFYDPYIGEWNK